MAYRDIDYEEIGVAEEAPRRVHGQIIPPDKFLKLIENPRAIGESLNLSDTQARNLVSLVSGMGAAGGTKYLGPHLGSEISAALGGFLGAFISRKIFGGR